MEDFPLDASPSKFNGLEEYFLSKVLFLEEKLTNIKGKIKYFVFDLKVQCT